MENDVFRLPAGGCIDRSQPVMFCFNGKFYRGYKGDTLASALLANGVFLTARSFKYHRPRGIIGAGFEEPSSMVELIGDEQAGSFPITTVRIREGLEAKSSNCWPSPDFDLMSINQVFSGLMPAAFYYKTFIWPSWKLFEPLIRKATGLASAPDALRHEGRFEVRHWHCDVLVIGAGPAGLVASLTAARSGARVLIADDRPEPGGALLNQRIHLDQRPAHRWISTMTESIDKLDNVTRLTDATAWAYREHNLVLITERCPAERHIFQRTWRVRAGRVVIATGALERSLVFANNDRPGVMLASAVQTYINRYSVKPGKRAVLFTNNNSVYPVAADMLSAGIDVAAIIDSREKIGDDVRAIVPKISIYSGHVVTRAHGYKHLKAVTISTNSGGIARRIDCDLVCLSGGWDPTVHLYSQSRGKLKFDKKLAAFVPAKPAQACVCAGAASGKFLQYDVLRDGYESGRAVAEQLGFPTREINLPATSDELEYSIEPLSHVAQHNGRGKCFVDIQNDVTLDDVHLAIREGFGAVEHVKRYTTAGMGIDQGKTGNVNVIAAIANKANTTPEQVGTTTFRSPYTPVEFGAIVGGREESVFLPYRHTPLTQWHKNFGAVMYEAGARWRRPGYYPRPGESFQETVNRESLAVRGNVAVYDGSPLGKFVIKGADSIKFIDMLYTNVFATLPIGAGRYGIMLSDDGIILDDGVTFKLAENCYQMFTSTGNADKVYQQMENFLQNDRPDWDVKITNITSQWGNATICGPNARKVMKALQTDVDLSPDAFPFMALREGSVAGIPARIFRVSFTGELSFEINVSLRYLPDLWNKIMQAGKPDGITPIGSEANHVLRVEKGFLSIGHEADGVTDPFDLGMGWVMSDKKQNYLGKRAIEIRRCSGNPRRELVGLLIDDANRLVIEGAPITPGGRRIHSEGFITACVWSVVQKRAVALALLVEGRSRIGQDVHIRIKNEVVTAKIVRPCFHDPDGKLLRS